MGVFDDTARQACKLSGPGLLGWVLAHCEPPSPLPLAFARWDDARRTTWPGGPERTDDVVAILTRTDGAEEPSYLIVENETEPQDDVLHRLGVYELLLAREARWT